MQDTDFAVGQEVQFRKQATYPVYSIAVITRITIKVRSTMVSLLTPDGKTYVRLIQDVKAL